MEGKSPTDKKIALVVAFRDFRDEEYFVPKEVLEKAGFEITTVSSIEGTAIGVQGGETKVDLLLDDLKVKDFSAIVFIGGTGAVKYFQDERAHRIAREAVEEGKILAAICIAPAILAKAGVLKGKKATVWSDAMDKSAIKILRAEGADYRPESVVRDGNIITANGPASAEQFARAIIKALTS